MRGQSQRGGDHSTNVQGESVTIVQQGLSVDDAKEIALALAREELKQFTAEATAIACARAEKMIHHLLGELQERNPEGITTFVDPDVQYALTSAQRAYVRTGDNNVADVLVDILVERTKETRRTLHQIVLNESLEAAAKLTPDQFAVLSLVFLITSTKYVGMRSRETLREYVQSVLAPFVPLIRTSNATFQHLEYAGCGAISVGATGIEAVFRDTYPEIFSSGFTAGELAYAFGGSVPDLGPLVIPCFDNTERLQLAPLDEEDMKQVAAAVGLADDDLAKLVDLSKRHLMSEDDVGRVLREVHPAMNPLMDAWKNSRMQNMTLTSVGIAIAHANCRRTIDDFAADLEIWIN